MAALSPENRALLMRANRMMGAALVEHNLVKVEDLEKANEKLFQIIASQNSRQSTLLGVLAFDMNVVKEEDVIAHVVEKEGIGLIDLRTYDVSEDLRKTADIGACWATWTVPFDKEDDFYTVATAYYLSPAVRKHWEKVLDAPIIWYATSLEMIADFLEKMESDRAASPGAAKH
ncbi:MAG: hypothetical protein K1X42_04165 [Opitutaceae bacterium]|nr:hypothetical protein [Opitutaceae bacterium]